MTAGESARETARRSRERHGRDTTWSRRFDRGGAGEELTAADRAGVAEQIAAAKVTAHEVSLDVTARVFDVTGARAAGSKYGFDRYWRDVRTHTLHDPVAYKYNELGRYFLNGTEPVPSAYR